MTPTPPPPGYPPLQPASASPEKWRRYVRLILRRWWVLLLFASISLCYQAYKLKQIPDEYSSSATLVLQGSIQLDKSSSYQEHMTSLFGTQKEILESRQLRTRVMDQLKLLHPELPRSSVHLHISHDNNSSVINIRARGREAVYTQAYLNAVLEQYMALRGEMRSKVSGQTLTAINEQLERLTTQIQKEEEALTAYHSENDIVVLQEGNNAAAAYLARLADKKADLETRLNFLRKLDIEHDIHRRNQLEGSNAANEQDLPQLASSEVDFLRTKREIALRKVELKRLSTIMKPKHPKIKALNARILEAEALLEVFRNQSQALNDQRARALEVELDNLNQEISTWEAKTLDTSRRLAESERLSDKLGRTRTLHEKLLLQMIQVDQARNLDQDNFSIMERASAPYKIAINTRTPMIKAAILGIAAGVLLLLLLNRFDDTLQSPGEYFERFDHDFLGSVPEIEASESNQILQPKDERQFYAESYRKLRSSILFKKWEAGIPKTVLVTSAIPFDGKSTVASNLAAVLAMSGAEVLLIDADLRRGALHDRFGTEDSPGLADVITGHCPLWEAIVETDYPNLDLLPRGKGSKDSVESLVKEKTKKLFNKLESVYDFVIVDSAPVLVADDTLSLAPIADTTLFVLRLHRTPARLAERALASLEQRQVDIGGVILNFDEAFVGDYYAYDYSKYYAEAEADK